MKYNYYFCYDEDLHRFLYFRGVEHYKIIKNYMYARQYYLYLYSQKLEDTLEEYYSTNKKRKRGGDWFLQ